MNPLTTPPSNTAPADEDLAEQARPGHGIPSQDPNPAAQIALEPQEAEREAQSVLVGGGVVAGAADLPPPSHTIVNSRKSVNQENDGYENQQIQRRANHWLFEAGRGRHA
nr:hypothetical protein [Rhodoferax sp.]